MSTSLTAWAPEVDPSIPGLPEPALKRAVRAAVMQFCMETRLWTLALARISVEEDVADYTLTVPAAQYGQIIVVEDVKYKIDGSDDDQFRRLNPIATAPENLITGNWQYLESSEPNYFDVEEGANTTLKLVPIPTNDSAEGLLVKVCLKPTLAAEVVPDFIYNQHLLTIAHGAMGYLFGIKGMPWYDPNEANYNRIEFRKMINSAKWRKFQGATNRPLSIRMRRWV